MPKNHRDPIQTVKGFLRTGRIDSSPTLATSIRSIKARLSRGRRVDRRIALGDALLAHLAGE
jgi:hypothetical protein